MSRKPDPEPLNLQPARRYLISLASVTFLNGTLLEIVFAALLGGGATTFYKARTDREATVATSAATVAQGVSEAAAALIGPLHIELGSLREKVRILELGKHECEDGMAQLRGEVAKLGVTSAIYETFAVAIVDLHGAVARIVDASDLLHTMLGWEPGELVGLPLSTILPERTQAAHRRHEHDFENDPRVRATGMDREVWISRKDGTELRVWIGLAPLNGHVAAVVLSR